VGVRPGLQRDQQGRVHLEHSSTRHQRDIRGISWLPEGIHFHYTPMTDASAVDTLSGTTTSATTSPAASSLGLFSRTDQGSRPVGHHLLLRVPGLLGRRRGVGHVGSHTTSATVLWRGPERPDQPDPLPWEIWARPIRFMQR
jgi:hypothetical protein